MNSLQEAGPGQWGCVIEIAPDTRYPSITAREVFRKLSTISGDITLESVEPDVFPGPQLPEEQIDRQFSYLFRLTTRLARAQIKSLIAGALKGTRNVIKVKLGHLNPSVATQTQGVPQPVEVAQPAIHEQHKVNRGSMRVDVTKIEELVNLIGELIINKNQVDSLSGQILDAAEFSQDVKSQLGGFQNARGQLSYVTGKLRDLALGIRMVPMSQLTRKFPGSVREMARKTGKQIRVVIEGEDTELDKAILEEIADPLMHIIRNAADHGIESPAERQKKGKYPEGTILIRAEHEGDRIAIMVEDDGAGLNEEKIVSKAVQRGIVAAKDSGQLQQREIHQLIFAPGFSTADKVSELSGRGVGMDVVKNNILRLNGEVEVESGRDVGSRISLKLPLTLSILEGLLLEDMGQTYAIPLIAIETAYTLPATHMKKIGRYSLIERNGRALPVFRAAELFGHKEAKAQESYYVIETSSAEGRYGLIVQRIVGRQEIVLKPLGDYLGKVTGISGSTILGDGTVALILDTKTMAASMTHVIREHASVGENVAAAS